MRIMKGTKGISFIEMNTKEIVRNRHVTRIVEAYDKDDKRKEKLRKQRIEAQKSENASQKDKKHTTK